MPLSTVFRVQRNSIPFQGNPKPIPLDQDAVTLSEAKSLLQLKALLH